MSILQRYNRVLSFPKIGEYLFFVRNHPTDPIVEKVIFLVCHWVRGNVVVPMVMDSLVPGTGGAMQLVILSSARDRCVEIMAS